MCPICISAAALATMAGTGSAGGLAAFVAVKLHLKRRPDDERAASNVVRKHELQSVKSGGGK